MMLAVRVRVIFGFTCHNKQEEETLMQVAQYA